MFSKTLSIFFDTATLKNLALLTNITKKNMINFFVFYTEFSANLHCAVRFLEDLLWKQGMRCSLPG